MNQNRIILWITFSSFILGCKQSPEPNLLLPTIAALNSELMALHDTTMIKHGECLALIDMLKLKVNTSGKFHMTYIDSIRTELDHSNESMMDWMAHYTDPIEKDSTAIHYLKAQLNIMKNISIYQTKNIELAKKISQDAK